jgi:hypothetical protein
MSGLWRENIKCLIYGGKTDKKHEKVLQTRCACPLKDREVSRALRVHMTCFEEEEEITQLTCKTCQKTMLLPLDDD